MKKVAIEIWDTVDGVLVSLDDVLQSIEPEAQTCSWIAHDLDLVGSNDLISALRQRITWRQFRELAKGIDQVIEGTFIGSSENSDGTSTTVDPLIIIECFDTTFWKIEAPSLTIERLRVDFKDTRNS